MAERIICAGEFYRHFKNKLYQVKQIAYHSETKEKMVVYQAMYGTFLHYVRPYDMFASEVDHEKYPEVKQKYRFEKVELKDLENWDKVIEYNENMALTVEKEENKIEENEGESQINPALLMFLDAESYRDKLNVLTAIRGKMDDRLINDIATSMDIIVPDGPIDERFLSIKNCVMAHAKYEESNRLR